MRILILMLCLCDAVEAQSIVTSSDRQSIVLSGGIGTAPVAPIVTEPVPDGLDEIRRELADIRKEIAQHGHQAPPAMIPVITPLPPVVTTVMPAVPTKIKRRGLAYFFSPSCGPCHAWRNSNLDKLRRKGYHVWEVDMSKPDNARTYPGVQRLPSFTVNDYETGKRESDVIVGGISFEEVERLLGTESAIAESQPVERTFPRQVQTMRDPAKRYAVWGGRKYDMESWRRQCSMRNCQMCIFLDNAQAVYFGSSVQQAEVPSPQSSSPADVVAEAIAIAKLTPADIVGELGSGDGKTAIQMVKSSGCRVVGVEIDPAQVAGSRANIEAAGLSHRITIIHGDVKDFDPVKHGVTVIYAYLYPELLSEITPALKAGRITICPGHKPAGLDMQLVGQCWVRSSQSAYATTSLPSGTGSIYDGNPGSSHMNRGSLIDHLLRSPVHAGRWNYSQLIRMTDEQLDAGHDRDHK